jgi:arsenate reductase-like glutaredoxin family protein
MSEFDLTDFEQREIKSKAVSEEELQEMYDLSNSYEVLFSKKSKKIKERNIEVKSYKKKILKN